MNIGWLKGIYCSLVLKVQSIIVLLTKQTINPMYSTSTHFTFYKIENRQYSLIFFSFFSSFQNKQKFEGLQYSYSEALFGHMC